jgi:hypothetical protein
MTSAVIATAERILRDHYADRVPDHRRIRADLAVYIAEAAVGMENPSALDAAERDAWQYLDDRAASQPRGSMRWRRAEQ